MQSCMYFLLQSIMKRKTSNLDFETYEDYVDSCYKEGVEVGLYSAVNIYDKKFNQYIQSAKNKVLKIIYFNKWVSSDIR